jgi:hypothetical protein
MGRNDAEKIVRVWREANDSWRYMECLYTLTFRIVCPKQ